MKFRRFLTWVSLIVILDQVSKWLVILFIPLGRKITIIPNIFDLVHLTNQGAAFGIFGGMPHPYRHYGLIIVALTAIMFISVYYFRLGEEEASIRFPLLMIIGGAIGNVTDRVMHGAVVDFLSVHWYDKWFEWEIASYHIEFPLEWPAFNVADSAISIAVVWILIVLLRHEKKASS